MSLLKIAQLQKFASSGVAKGVVKAYIAGRRSWGHINTLCSHLKARFNVDI